MEIMFMLIEYKRSISSDCLPHWLTVDSADFNIFYTVTFFQIEGYKLLKLIIR